MCAVAVLRRRYLQLLNIRFCLSDDWLTALVKREANRTMLDYVGINDQVWEA